MHSLYSQEEVNWAQGILEKQNGFLFKTFNKAGIEKAKRIMVWKQADNERLELKRRRDEEYRLQNERDYQTRQQTTGIQIEDVILANMLIPGNSGDSSGSGSNNPSSSSDDSSDSNSYSSYSSYSSYNSYSSSSDYNSSSSDYNSSSSDYSLSSSDSSSSSSDD